jgi:membrane associated rhomboid family serine protease
MNPLRELDRELSRRLTPAVRIILYVNVAVHLLGLFGLADWLYKWFSEYAPLTLGRFQIWRLVTHMFLHGSGWHLVFNMLILWFFGPPLERRLGSRHFLRFYPIAGVGAGLVHAAVMLLPFTRVHPMVGASGALMGVLFAMAAFDPHRPVIFFIFPMKMWTLVALFMAIDVLGLVERRDNVSNLTHLAGAAVAYVYFGLRLRCWDVRRWRWLV